MQIQPDKDFFVQLIAENKGIIVKICNAYCNHTTDREDLAQEIIYALWKGYKIFKPDFKFSTWMYRVALNVAISFYRKQKNRNEIATPFHESFLNFADISTTDKAEVDFNYLQQFISELKELDKALLLLYLDEKSYKEIGDVIGLTETNVATKLGRIKATLKQKFSLIKN